MSFYVTLPSNASVELYSENTATNYTTQLKLPLKFDIPYEVALVEMIYKHSWMNYLGTFTYSLEGDENEFELFISDGEDFSNLVKRINEWLDQVYITSELAKLEYAEDIEVEKKNIRKHDNYPRLFYFEYRLSFMCNRNSYFIFSGYLGKLFKVDKQVITLYQDPLLVSKNILNITQALFVYTDIIDFQYVGDTLAPLLKTISTPGEDYATVVSAHFDNPHYISVNKTLITSINIDIRDDTGKKIFFEDGRVIVKLHFRPRKNGF